MISQGREIDLLVGTDVRDGSGTTRAINWCGCVVQDPHPAVRALGFLPEEGHGVYVARYDLLSSVMSSLETMDKASHLDVGLLSSFIGVK